MRTPNTAVSAFVLIGCILAGRADAQVRTPIAPGPRLPPAPAPIIAAVDQAPGAIWGNVRFDLPPNTAAIRVTRQDAAGTQVRLTPNDVPLASVGRTSDGKYGYYDQTLTAMGTYSYSVAAVLDDGRVGTSGWFTYAPQIYEARTVNVQKTSPYSALVVFSNGLLRPQVYRLYGTGLVTYGVEAVMDKMGRGGSVQINNLAAGTYNWVLRAEFQPGIRSNGVPVSITLP
jgi:hypothetical protein